LFDVLAAIRRSGSPYRVRPSDLADSLMLTSGGTTKRLDRLERSGLIERHHDEEDRRALLIELTPAGRKLVDAVVTEHVANENRLLGGLGDAERRQLARLLRKLQTGLPPPG
jgi:DNA-binding MarR family transcriptional regulator